MDRPIGDKNKRTAEQQRLETMGLNPSIIYSMCFLQLLLIRFPLNTHSARVIDLEWKWQEWVVLVFFSFVSKVILGETKKTAGVSQYHWHSCSDITFCLWTAHTHTHTHTHTHSWSFSIIVWPAAPPLRSHFRRGVKRWSYEIARRQKDGGRRPLCLSLSAGALEMCYTLY